MGKNEKTNTQEALAYGEKARNNHAPEEMIQLLENLIRLLAQYLANASFNIQMFNEAFHAFKADDWYLKNK